MEKVMIIENNDMMRLFLTNYLSGDYEVETAETPKEALEKMNGMIGSFSLVVSDYQAPISQELKDLVSLETALSWQNVPLVILTDADKSDQRIAAFECGASDCLSKPFNPKELSMRLKGLTRASDKFNKYRKVA